MVIILLLLILLTLLFGAGAVTSGIARTIAIVAGGGPLFFVIMWIGTAFREGGTKVSFWTVMAIITVAALAKLRGPTGLR